MPIRRARPCLALALALTACGDDPRGDGAGLSSTGVAAPDPTAGAVPTAPVPDLCERYLECLDAVRPDAYNAAQRKYGPRSSCWQDPGATAQCIAACDAALIELHKLHPLASACMTCKHDAECDALAGEFCFTGGCELFDCEPGDASLCL